MAYTPRGRALWRRAKAAGLSLLSVGAFAGAVYIADQPTIAQGPYPELHLPSIDSPQPRLDSTKKTLLEGGFGAVALVTAVGAFRVARPKGNNKPTRGGNTPADPPRSRTSRSTKRPKSP